MTEYSEAEIREQFSHFLVTSSKNSCPHFHIPNDLEEKEPFCALGDRKRHTMKAKPIEVYPEGYHPICKQCLNRVEMPE